MKKIFNLLISFILLFSFCACTFSKDNNTKSSSRIEVDDEGNITYIDNEKSIYRWQKPKWEKDEAYHYSIALDLKSMNKNYNIDFQDKQTYHIILKKENCIIFDDERESNVDKKSCSFQNLYVKKEIEDKIKGNYNYQLVISDSNKQNVEMNFKMEQ